MPVCLSVCLFVYPINVKTAKPIRFNYFMVMHKKVTDRLNFKNKIIILLLDRRKFTNGNRIFLISVTAFKCTKKKDLQKAQHQKSKIINEKSGAKCP